ncbi:hypothetical protein N7451_005700 [Penicillium sp. IBT 35674x]|nr:hypothetical protein N7451_005700 [Penicillium sp. IBT 35674x]
MEAASPTDIAGSKLIEAYSANSHRRLPFLDQSEILHLHMKRDQLLSSTSANPWDCFKLFMVYAIGSAMQKMTERYNSLSPEELFQTALKFKAPIMESRSVENIQAILLLIIYNLRTSSSSTIWYLIGLAMKTAIDLGLHREFNYHGLKPDQAQTKRRVFWSVYMLERHIAWSLGRPFGIAERDIDVGLPENFEKCLQVNGSAQLNADEEIRSLGPFIPSLQLARIRSRIHTKIYRVDKEVSTLLPLVGPLLSELEDYKRSIPPNLLQSDNEWLHMHWNNGVRMLLQPFLSELPPDHDLAAPKRLPRIWIYTIIVFSVVLGCDRSVCLKTYRDIWENIVTTVMEYLGRVLDHSDLSIDGDSNGRSRSDVGTIEEFRTPAALDDWMLPAIVYEDLLPSGYIETTEGVTAPHILHDTSAAQNVQDIQFHQQQLSSFEYCWSNFDRNVRSQEQPDTRQYPPEIEQILAEDFWAGDSIRSQMLTELVSQSAILL